MKCEICHQRDAESAIQIMRNGAEDELYVCRECAKAERIRRQKKSQSTRKEPFLPPGVSMSVTQIGGGEPPPQIIEALMNAVQGVVSGIDRVAMGKLKKEGKPLKEATYEGFDNRFVVAGGLQLEGLFLIGEIEAVKRAMHALDMEIVGYNLDGVADAGHIYKVKYSGDPKKARRVVCELVIQELSARTRLIDTMPRVIGDSICRSLAILKNARLLSPGELFDLLSPLRLAALENLIEGISFDQIEELITSVDLFNNEDTLDMRQRDKVDAARADEMNRRFEDVVLNEKGERRFL